MCRRWYNDQTQENARRSTAEYHDIDELIGILGDADYGSQGWLATTAA